MKRINRFQGEYFFLSNFSPYPVDYEGIEYPTSEHAFQAAKTLNKNIKKEFLKNPSPSFAKKLGRRIKLRSDWEEVKDGIMYDIILYKFHKNKNLRDKLLGTGEAELAEGNTWGDRYWGIVKGEGKNKLGKILMEVRSVIRKAEKYKNDSEKNIGDSEEYKKRRKEILHYFKDENIIEKSEPFQSPSRFYDLFIYKYKTKKGHFNFSQGIIKKGEEIVADIKRNYGHFPFLWVEHPNGNEYLICGEDYQGYTIINVNQNQIYNYVPKTWENGAGFCWIDYKFDSDYQHLLVEGCYWAFPYEIVTYDFCRPERLPLPELYRKLIDK